MDQRLLRRRAGQVFQVSGFVQAAKEINFTELATEYDALRSTAPSRHASGRRYFVEHTSVAGMTSSNRTEEHLAASLLSRSSILTPRGTLNLIDFQFPLKAYRSDRGLGKVDLLGLMDSLVVIELKVHRPGGGGDTPLGASLEALVYSAVIEANHDDIGEEMKERALRAPVGRPEILVLGTDEYWGRWDQSSACEGWRHALAAVASGVHSKVGIDLWFGLLSSEPPQIKSVLT